MIYNELDILNIRLHELYDIVDNIIIIEATKTHTGNPKPLYYLENKQMFSKYSDKIIHIVTTFDENYNFSQYIHTNTEHWYREHYQRECIRIGLDKMNLNNEDIIIVTDVDEIPNKCVIQNIKNNILEIKNNIVYSLTMTLYYYNIELTTPRKWHQSKLFNFFTYKHYNLLTEMRYLPPQTSINNGGWHLSYFGDENFIKNKVESFAESIEYTKEGKNINYLKECLDKSILHFNKEILIRIPLKTNENVPTFFKELHL